MNRSSKFSAPLVGTLVLLGGTWAATRVNAHRTPESLAQPLSTINRQISGFTGTDNPPLRDDVLAQLAPTSYLSRTYRKADLHADLFIAFYAQQRAGESMHSPKHCLPGGGWEIWDYGSADIPTNQSTVRVNNYSIAREGEHMLVLYWYQSKGRIIAKEYTAKLLLARDALLKKSTAASIVRIIVPDKPGSFQEARSFASELIPQIQRCFGQ